MYMYISIYLYLYLSLSLYIYIYISFSIGTSLFDTSDMERMKALAEMKTPDLLHVFPRLQAMPAAVTDTLLKESLYLHSIADLLQKMSRVALQRQTTAKRTDRTIDSVKAMAVSSLRSAMNTVSMRVSKSIDALFQTGDIGTALGAAAQKRLGVGFNTSHTKQTIETAGSLVSMVLKEWLTDLTDLQSSMSKWMIDGVRSKVPQILHRDNDGIYIYI